MSRSVFIGDVHGCYDEVCDLLTKIGVSSGDRVVALGDLVRKGPQAGRCIDLWQEQRYEAVLGNNDATLLARAANPLRRLFASGSDGQVVRSPRRLAFLRALPLYRDYPDLGVVAVHGGILPNSRHFSGELVTGEAALQLRRVRRDDYGRWSFVPKGRQRPADPFWADIWDGDRLVVYGHTPRKDVKLHARAIGLDTGCVYGGALSAAVFTAAGQWQIVSVRARRQYAR